MSRRDHRWFGRIKYLAISFLLSLAVAVPTLGTPAQTAAAADLHLLDMLSAGGIAALFGPGPGNNNFQPGVHDNGRGGNSFVNDPCLDPLPPGQRGTVQSEDELAILNTSGSMGKLMVAGYNDSLGFTDRREGLSGYAYSANGGNTWIDGTGLPLVVPGPGDNLPGPHPGQDGYFGDPVIVVRHSTRTFWYASIYRSANGYFTLSVNRGRFQTVSPTTAESISNTRCLNDPAKTGIPDPPNQSLRIVWERPVEAVQPANLGLMSMDLLDKEWLYVDQRTGELYLTYTRFAFNGMTRNAASIEMVRSFDGGQNWTAPVVIAPSSPMSFNHSTQPVTTPG